MSVNMVLASVFIVLIAMKYIAHNVALSFFSLLCEGELLGFDLIR
jgi:hypothetical protein